MSPLGQPKAILAVEGDLDGETLGFETALDDGRDLLVILDQQNLHSSIVSDRT
jgi:hypothetical protein